MPFTQLERRVGGREVRERVKGYIIDSLDSLGKFCCYCVYSEKPLEDVREKDIKFCLMGRGLLEGWSWGEETKKLVLSLS